MSQTQRTSHDHQMYIFNSKFIVRAVRIMLPAAIVLAMVWPASAAAITWNHTSGTLYWDNTANWSPSTAVPGSGDDVTFGNTGAVVLTTPPTVTNEVRSDITINSLVYAPTLNVQTTKVDPSVLLKIKGAVAAPSTADGNVSLWACAAAAGADDVSQSLFTGGGLMDISTSTGGNTGGDIVVRQTNGTAGLHNSILDLSGLTSFNANVDQLLIAYATSSVDRPNGTLYLAQNNTITLNNTGTITSSTSADGGLIVGFAGNHATGQPANLYLGQTNTINVQNAYIAGRRQIANMLFAPIYSSTSPTLKMRGIDGTSRVTLISIGDNTGNGTGSTNVATGTMDLTGGIADIMATSIILGTSNASSTSHSQGGRGTLTFNAGTIDTTSMILGNETANLNMTSASDGDYGAVNVNGTAHLIVGSGGIVLGSYFGGGNGVVTGTLNIRNTATVTVNGTIQAGGVPVSSIAGSYSNISMSGGTLDMTGHAIGSTGPINVFTVSGGSIVNLASLTVNTFKVNSNYSLTSGPLTLNNGGAVDMRNGAANTFTVNNLTLQATPSLYFELSNSLSSGNDQMTVGTLNLGSGSTTTIKISPLSSSFASGRYNLINYTSETGSTTWGVSNTTRNTMSNPQDDTTNKQIYLNISPASAHDLTWSGGTNTSSAPGIWDWNTTANWTSSSGSDKYYDLDTVTFTTNAGGASFIKLQNTFPGATAAGVGFIPGSVTVNSDSDYTFTANTQGSDRISGSTTLYKDGTGTLTMSVSNDYTGATTIHAGTIVLGNAAGLGTGSLTIQNGGTLDLHRLSLGGKAITVTGAGVGGLGAIVNNSTSTPDATQNDVSNVTLSGDTTFGGLATIVTNSSGVNT
ncbi:MAG: autotransporter-associated beta strand repeat-containing protein, partial [Thermoguttaceae bacterium]